MDINKITEKYLNEDLPRLRDIAIGAVPYLASKGADKVKKWRERKAKEKEWARKAKEREEKKKQGK
jgi:hypothetical protein